MWNRIETRIFVFFLANVILWISLLSYLFFFIAARSLEDQLNSTLRATATVLASQWDGSLLLSLEPGMEEGELYQTFVEKLKVLKDHTQVERIYITGRERRNIISTEGSIPLGQSLPRLDLLGKEWEETLKGNAATSEKVEVEGRIYKSALAPIYSGNEIAAVLIVDMSPQYLTYLRTFRNSLLFLTLISLLLCAVSARVFSKTITNPIGRMLHHVEEIGRAKYEIPLEVSGKNELSQLARSIEAMRRNILQRDEQMRMMLLGIAHEIRNPLGGMELFAGILEKENLNPDQREYLQRIRYEIHNLNKLLNEFLDFAQTGRLKQEPVVLSDLLSEIRISLESDLQEKEARWEIESGSEDPSISGDRTKLKQALLNLYKNAIQAVPHGGSVSSLIKRTQDQVVIEIGNSQIGMLPREIEDNIFRPFYTTRERGMGLGLPLARKIIESHGGKLWLISNESEKLVFGVEIPMNGAITEAQDRLVESEGYGLDVSEPAIRSGMD